jgi:hypothetical protein
MMSISTATRRLSLLGTVAAAAIGLAALTTPTSPANAQVYFGFDAGPFAFGVGTPGYYPPVYPYSYPYYPNYYGGYHYPGYAYPGYYYPW